MDVATIKQRGGVIDAAPVPKDVEWTHPDPETGEQVTDKFKVHVVRHSFGAAERLLSGPEDQSRGAMLISKCIRLGDDATESFTYDEAFQLDPALAFVLVKAINEVNAAKNSPPPMKSGTS